MIEKVQKAGGGDVERDQPLKSEEITEMRRHVLDVLPMWGSVRWDELSEQHPEIKPEIVIGMYITEKSLRLIDEKKDWGHPDDLLGHVKIELTEKGRREKPAEKQADLFPDKDERSAA